jgi:hypothetical protein
VVNAVSGGQAGRAAAVLAEHEVQQRWASCEEMATGGPSRFPGGMRCQAPQGCGSLSHEFNGRSGQA